MPSQPGRVILVRAKQNVFLPQVQLMTDYLVLNTHSTVEDWRNWGEMKLNEPGKAETR